MENNICPSTVNTSSAPGRKIEYIVIHYTAGTTSKAGTGKAVCKMWASGGVKASADFVVDDGGTWQYNADLANRYTWAVGGSKYNTKGGRLYGICKNSNSISVEMCSSNSTKMVQNPCDSGWNISTAVRNNTIALVRHLMDFYHIPIDRVIRHYDCTGKPCPGVLGWCEYGNSTNSNEWVRFKEKLSAGAQESDGMTEREVEKLIDRHGVDAVKAALAEMAKAPGSDWAQIAMEWAVDNGITDGTKPGAYCTREQVCTMLYRFYKLLKK